MPMHDLSLVTTTLVRLLERYVPMSPVWGGAPPVGLVVTGDPPDLVKQLAGDHVLAVYLFHVEEDPGRKNDFVPVSSGQGPPVRFQSLGLNLYFLLAAYGGSQPNLGAYRREQRLIGIAMKALHDHAIIDRSTVIPNPAFAGDEEAFPAELRDQEDRLRITAQPVALDQASQMWQAANVPRRLATVYQVGVVLLEAEPALTPPPALHRALDVAPGTLPTIASTASTVVFVDAAGASHPIEVSPALVEVGETFTIRGTGLGAAELRISAADGRWDPPSADATSWIAARRDDRIDAVVRPVVGRDLVPGSYAISAVVGRAEAIGSIAITAAIAGVSPATVAPGGAFRVSGGPFSGPAIRTAELFIGPIALRAVVGAPAAGQFRVMDAATIDAVAPSDRPEVLQPGRVLPVRVFVNAIPSKPGPRLTVA
jgi:hypothetical protein